MNRFLLLFCFLGLSFACTYPQFEATVIKHYSSFPGEESFTLYKGTSEAGIEVLTVAGVSTYINVDMTYSICMEQGDYFIQFVDSYGDGWGTSTSAAYVTISVGGIQIYRGGLPYQSGTTLKNGSDSFTVNLLSSPLSEWKYTDTPQTSNDWTQSSYNDASWSTATAGNFPAFTATTRYYRFTGTITNRATIPTLYSAVNNTYGFVYYLQGTEVYRYHMPTGTISSTSVATLSDGSYAVAASAYKFLLPSSGSFVIAYEVHLTSGISGVDDNFACFAYIGPSRDEGDYGRNIFVEGVANSDPVGTSTTYTVAKMFDESTTYYYYTTSSSTPVITYTFNSGRCEWINYYKIQSAYTLTYGYPTAWTVYGSNDGVNWDTLDIKSNAVFATTNLAKYYSLRATTKCYNQFKLAVTACSVSGQCGIGKFHGYVGVFAQELTSLAYDTTSFTGYALIDSISMSPIINGYGSFTSDPALPDGVVLSPTTGAISGTPTVGATSTYTITGINYVTSQPSSVTISLNISPCSAPTRSVVRFMKVSQTWASEESYTVTDSAGQTYTSPIFSNSVTQYMYYCFPAGVINVHLADSFGDGWTANSRLHIQMFDYEGDYYTISSIYERKGGINDFSYDVSYKIYPRSSSWTYSTTLVPNWYGAGAVTGFNAFDPANPPSSSGQYVWFFRSTVTMSSTGYDGFELRVKARAGYVVYINGVEFIRKNLPAGDISTTTGATGGESTSTYRFISGPNSVFTAGSNVIAIGIVNLLANNPDTLLFDATLQQMMPNDIGRSFDVTVTANPIGTGIAYINDLVDTSYWYADQPSKADFVIDFTYESHRAEHFNKHCVTSSTMTDAYDPSDWAIYGSNDGETFELLGNVTNAYFSDRTVNRCFYMPDNKKAYNQYRMVVTETAVPTVSPYGLAIAEVTFSMVDLDQLVIPDFSLDATSYTGYIGVPFPEVTPTSDLYSDYSIFPALQLPLEIDTSTGSIRGTPITSMSPAQYTISAKNPKGETRSVVVTLSVVECLYPNNQFSILIQSGNAGEEMGFQLKDSNGNPLLTKNRFTNGQANYYPQCRPTGSYTLSLTDSGGDGWDIGYFRVLLADETIILYGSLGENEAAKDFNFYVGYLVTPLYASYQYLNSGASAPTDWTQPQSSATSTWQEAKPGAFGNFAGTTAYFRKTFTITDLSSYAALAFTVKTTYGVIVYINGEKVYTYNMPTRGTISYDTKCLVKRNQLMNVGSSIAVQYSNLVVGTNVVCFEVHVFDPAVTNVIDFDSTIQLTADGSFRLLDGEPSSDLAVDETISKLFDNIKGTVYASGPRCVGAAPTWTYNNDRREFVSSYTIITGPTCNVRTPSSWRFEATNDGRRWSVLHEVTKDTFEEYSVERTYNFYNTRVFNQYRMVVTECSNSEISTDSTSDCSYGSGNGFQLAELSMFAKRLQAACEPTDDGFRGAVEGQYAYKDCDEYYQGRYQAMCTGGQLTNIQNNCSPMAVYGIDYGTEFITISQKTDFSYTPTVSGAEYSCTISPELPTGVSFEASTGRIYGRYDEISSFTYTVTCTNVAGSYSSKLTLSFIEKSGLDLWVWIIMVVLIVIIILVLVLCIVNRMKSKKTKSGHSKLDKKASSKAKAASSKRGADGSAKAVKV